MQVVMNNVIRYKQVRTGNKEGKVKLKTYFFAVYPCA